MNDQQASASDLDQYIATFDAAEREELVAAEAALDLAFLLYQARTAQGLNQTAAAERAGLKQQTVSRLEHPGANVRLDTIRRYLSALGYSLDIAVRDIATGCVIGRTRLPPLSASERPAMAQRPKPVVSGGLP
jgi:DNA-binding XRE family transcriptional regulator